MSCRYATAVADACSSSRSWMATCPLLTTTSALGLMRKRRPHDHHHPDFVLFVFAAGMDLFLLQAPHSSSGSSRSGNAQHFFALASSSATSMKSVGYFPV